MTTAAQEQAQKHQRSHATHYTQSLRERQPEQAPRPEKISARYVARDEVHDGREYIGVKVSPAFRTPDEAFNFMDTCGIDGVYCLEVTLYPRNNAEAEQMNKTIFTEQEFLA